jgi:hypothetical protein
MIFNYISFGNAPRNWLIINFFLLYIDKLQHIVNCVNKLTDNGYLILISNYEQAFKIW